MNRIILILSIMIISFSVVHAQGIGVLRDARSASLGNSTIVSSSGVFALGENPANIAITSGFKFELSTILPFPNTSFIGGTNFLSIADYNKYFTGQKNADGSVTGIVLSDADKNQIIDLFTDSRLGAGVRANLLSAVYHHSKEVGSFGISINDRVFANASLPKAVFEFVFFGNRINQSYNLNDLSMTTAYTREYALTYARDITSQFFTIFKRITAGLSLKLMSGYFYSDLEKVNSSFITNDDVEIKVVNNMMLRVSSSPDFGIKHDFEDADKESSISPFPSSAGTGFGLDFGFNAKLDDVWSFGLALNDLGFINWNEETVGYSVDSSVVFDDFTESDNLDSLSKGIEPEGGYIAGFRTGLPGAVVLGASMQLDKAIVGNFPGTLLLVLNYRQGFNSAMGNTTSPIFSFGTEYRPVEWLPLRTGFTFGGLNAFSWALGFGLGSGLYEFNLAVSDFQSLISESGNTRFGIALSSRWRF